MNNLKEQLKGSIVAKLLISFVFLCLVGFQVVGLLFAMYNKGDAIMAIYGCFIFIGVGLWNYNFFNIQLKKVLLSIIGTIIVIFAVFFELTGVGYLVDRYPNITASVLFGIPVISYILYRLYKGVYSIVNKYLGKHEN